ncbi:MAG: hypothetical protein ACXWB2_02130 [Acidimicrobiales bacterium]
MAYLVVGFVLLVVRLGRQQWFWLDEWDFLSTRTAGDLGDLLRPHNEHWSTLPVLVYRALFAVFGLTTYKPYLVTMVVVHLAAVVLVRVVMRRAGVSPWVATFAAGLLVLFGPGYQNIVWGFQIGFVGALAFGLGQLILSDHDGPPDLRDWLGLVSGLAALMCSGVGVTMVAIVGLATLLRRGWRMAAFHVLPLAAAYGIWALAERPPAFQNPTGAGPLHIADVVVRFALQAVRSAFSGLGHVGVVGALLGVVLVVGLVLAWAPISRADWRRQASLPVALLAGAVLFVLTSGTGRWFFGPEFARQSRYAYLVAALVLPALAVAADALIERWRPVALVLGAVAVFAMVTNARAFDPPPPFVAGYYRNQQQMLGQLADSPLAAAADPSVQPDPGNFPGMTIGWLLAAKEAGALPASGAPNPGLASQLPVRLGFGQSIGAAPSNDCKGVSEPFEIKAKVGQTFSIRGPAFSVSAIGADGKKGQAVTFTPDPYQGLDPQYRHTFTVTLPKLDLYVQPSGPLTVCT